MPNPTVEPTTHTDMEGGGESVGESVLTEEPVETVDTQPAAAEPAQFTIPEQFASDPRFEGVESVEQLFEKLAEQPSVPASIDEYETALAGAPDEIMADFKASMLKAGLTKEQYGNLVEYYNNNMTKNQEQRAKIVDGFVEKVRSDWGDNYDKNLAGAKTALKAAAADIKGLREMMQDPALGSHPVTLELFRWISEKISEDVIRTSDAPGRSRRMPEQGGVRYFESYDKTMEK